MRVLRRFTLAVLMLMGVVLLVACNKEANTVSQAQAKELTEINFQDVQDKMNEKDEFYLYIGRPTYPYCQKFYPKLLEAVGQTGQQVYYLNTDEEDKDAVKSYFSKYGLKTVPSLSHFSGEEQLATLDKGSQSSVEEIVDLLKN